ncbi:hypothetical protein FJR48_02825 [Sulfurimonas lithotrophica]|uniref:SH3 domain-containing protein n=1 Tax=Sulfurimonas lithotrophica TaxID=2590022 RepID=A0A5P8P423_9BACT|nr:hypothetical protein FJR48_02825 [Sulfurimonas lithotrophica]
MQSEKVLYVNYEDLPKRIVKGEIFPITIRLLSTTDKYEQIKYNFSNQDGLKSLNSIPYRVENGKYFYDTFYYLANSSWARLPDIEAYIEPNPNNKYESTVLKGKKLNVITLNPKNNFSNIIAEHFGLVEYKTTSFDNLHNIIVFVAEAKRCDIANIEFKNVYKQGIESIIESIEDSKITYFVVVDKKVETFKFSYFNLEQNRFNNIHIPIIVDDDKVTTQTDLKPKDQSKERIKLIIALSVALVLLILIVWRKKYIYSILLIFPVAYITFLSAPSKNLCIEEGSNIYLLPVSNGTIFETTSETIYLQQEGKAKGFVKVKLKSNKIGWVKNENICKY